MQDILQHIQTNGMTYVLAGVFVFPLLYLFRAQTVPIIYHTAEYIIYCTAFHYLVGGFFRVGWWYRSETAFKRPDGSLMDGLEPYTTPLNMHFWEKELYSPQGAFYFELVAAFAILYLVVVVRPMRYKRNVYRRRIEKPLENRSPRPAHGPDPAISRNRMTSRRDRLQKIRGTR